MSSAPLKTNLPDFFQSAGYSGNNTLLSQLEDFELGGLEEDEEENNENTIGDGGLEPLNTFNIDLNDEEADEGDDEAFSEFHNKIVDITKSPSRNTSMSLSSYGAAIPPPFFGNNNASTAGQFIASSSTASSSNSTVNTKTNALDMLKVEMGLKNNNANNSNSSSNNNNFNFVFPTDTHLPPGFTGNSISGANRAEAEAVAVPQSFASAQSNNSSNNMNMTMPRHLQQPQPPYPPMPLPPQSLPPPTPQYAQPPQQLQQPQPFIIPRSNMMRTTDVRFVLNKVLQPMESPDPYSDDFYYIQFQLKRNAAAYEKIRRGEQNTDGSSAAVLVPSFAVPLPTWKDTKPRIKSQILESQRSLDDRVRKWEEKERVLGHQTRSNIARPRELLSLSSLNNNSHSHAASSTGNIENGVTATDVFTDSTTVTTPSVLIATITADEFRPIFSTRLWSMRRAVQRAHEALQTVQELEHLLRTPLIWENVEARQEVLEEVDEAVALLAQAIGIRSVKSLHVVDEGYMGLGYAHGHVDSAADITIDGFLIAALLQSAKGKKLIVRAFGPLPPEKRWLLVPPIITRVLQTDHAASSTEEKDAEVTLIQTCVQFFKQAYLHANSLKTSAIRAAPVNNNSSTSAISQPQYVTFIKQLLTHFRQCVKSVLVTFMEKNQLRKVLLIDEVLSDKTSTDNKKNKNHRLGLFQSLIATGDQLATDLTAVAVAAAVTLDDSNSIEQQQQQQWATADDWRQIKETFLAMIDDE